MVIKRRLHNFRCYRFFRIHDEDRFAVSCTLAEMAFEWWMKTQKACWSIKQLKKLASVHQIEVMSVALATFVATEPRAVGCAMDF